MSRDYCCFKSILCRRYYLGPVYMELGGPQLGEVTCGRSPHLLCKRDQMKMRDYMDRQVIYPTKAGYLNYLGSPTSI